MGEQPFDGALEVLVEAAALRVEDDVLAGDGEEPLEISLLALGEGVALVPLRLLLADGVQALQFLAGLMMMLQAICTRMESRLEQIQ